MSKGYDVIVIGGGHNGLGAAALLAQAGRSVLLLERRSLLGGAAVTEEIFPGFRFNTGAHDAGLFRPEVVEALNLDRHGLEFVESPITAFAPQPEGTALALWRNLEKSQAEIARFSEIDAEKFPAFVQAVDYITGLLDGMMVRTPPSLTEDQIDQFLPWFRASLGPEGLTTRTLNNFVRILFLSAAEFLNEWFDGEALKGLLATSGLTGSMQGPKSPGTALTMLYHYLGAAGTGFRSSKFVRGGMGQLSISLAEAARTRGVEIQTGAEVARIITDDGQATGVVLIDGTHFSAQTIVSNADPRRTFFDLVGPDHLEVRFVRKVNNIRFRGTTAKVNLALRELPRFTSLSSATDNTLYLSGHILISPTIDYLERAYDDAKYGRFSQAPYLDIVIPTLLDPSLAPAGQHTMSIIMQYAPYRLRQGAWNEQRKALGHQIIDTLAQYAPNLKEIILHQQILAPLDLEREYGLPDGAIYHGQMELDQMLFMRPVAGYGQYRTPIKNLYLCGAGTHPGGGLTGAPGYNAAREILAE